MNQRIHHRLGASAPQQMTGRLRRRFGMTQDTINMLAGEIDLEICVFIQRLNRKNKQAKHQDNEYTESRDKRNE
ncbi:hypothetical protein [Edwardsiella tarda]|uniref:hypothetical protein n=1 Tax=Edwardsiella tarda TaxID=636 RepID=UPI00351C1C20